MTPAEFYEQELGKRRDRWQEDEFLPALFEAVQLCSLWEIPLPEWASLATLNLIITAYNESMKGGVEGAHGSTAGRTRMDYAHWLRWRSVRDVLVLHGLRELPERKRGRPKPDTVTRAALVSEATARLRKNRLAKAGQNSTVEESYEVVEASLARGEHRFRFDDLHTF